MVTKIIKQNDIPLRAFSNYQSIRKASHMVAANILELGRLFYDNQNNKYYEVLGYESWREFLGDPDIAYAESTVRSFVNIYKKYVLKLAVAPQLLMEIGHGKLQIISPVVESDPDEWLGRAKALSKSDLIYEVRGESSPGRLVCSGGTVATDSPLSQFPMPPDEYVELVKKSPCCVCGLQGNTVAHHHPRTKAMTDYQWHVFPLCGECHALYHSMESVYRHDWAKFFYGWLFKLVVKEE